MSIIILIGIVLVLLLYAILKETISNGEDAHNQRNAWEKQHGREMNKNGIYEDREVIAERARRENEEEY